MKHFMAQFGTALSWPGTKLMAVPEFTPELVELIAGQSDAQSGRMSIRELERLRDDNLVGMMRALKQSGSGAGGVIRDHEAQLPLPKTADVPVTLDLQVPPGWADYNGHMNEAQYLEAASKATDRCMDLIGADAAYVAAGQSYFTVESHVRFLAETHVGRRLIARTRLLDGAGKKLHLFHELFKGEGAPVATVEPLLLHVDLATRNSSLPAPEVAGRLAEIAGRQAGIPVPVGVGRHVGQKAAG